MILCDFNINLTRCLPSEHQGTDNYALQFSEWFLSCNLYPVCFILSCVPDSSMSFIDNILSPYTREVIIFITDEYHIIVAMLEYKIQKTFYKEIIAKKRKILNKNIHSLKVALGDLYWNKIVEMRDPDRSLDIFQSNLKGTIRSSLPF
jgi:hypothetical protein